MAHPKYRRLLLKIIGEALDIDSAVNRLGDKLQQKFKGHGKVTEGFVTGTLVFAVGAMTILTSVMQFAMLPLQGLAQGAQPITSYNYGARNAARVKKVFRLLLTICLSYSLVLWGAVMLMPRMFAGIFTPDEALLDFAAKALRIYCGGLGLFGIQIACQMTFVSLGNAPCSILVAVVRKFVLLLPLIYLMPMLVPDKTMGVYMAEPVADVIAVTFTAVLFAFQFSKSMKKLEKTR